MRVEVDQELCISCGTCIDLCPDVFKWNDEDKATGIAGEMPAAMEEQVREAIESCPTEAISEV